MARKPKANTLGEQLCGGMGSTRVSSQFQASTVPGQQAQLRVEVVPARCLFTIGPADSYWKIGVRALDQFNRICEGRASGSIFRIRPPADASDEAIEDLVNELKNMGAEACTVQPRERAAAVVPREAVKRTSSSARKVVRDMIEEARSDDRGALRAECEDIMQEVGLR